MIEFREVSKFYDTVTALRSINLTIEKGEMVFLTGPSGAGKTTFLKLIYAAEFPDNGKVMVSQWESDKLNGSSIPKLRRNIGVVFQDFRLLSNRNVFDNVALALRVRKVSEKEIKPIVLDALKMVNLRHKTDGYPSELSGGEQQRVVIARAIVGDPAILLADEPTGNLDPDTAAGIIRIFKDINARGVTMLIATHNPLLFRDTGKRVLRLDNAALIREEQG